MKNAVAEATLILSVMNGIDSEMQIAAVYGAETEVEIFAGKVLELGKQYAVPTPVNETLYRILRVAEHYLE